MFKNFKPTENETVIFIVKDCTDYSYDVVLPGYEQQATLLFSELSKKKIRKNPQTFLKKKIKYAGKVLCIEDGVTYISYKDIESSEESSALTSYELSNKFFNLPQRICHLSKLIDLDTWCNSFVDCLRHEDQSVHPLEIISNRESLSNYKILPACLQRILLDHHKELFGIKLESVTLKIMIMCFGMDGNEAVKQALSGVLFRYSKTYTPEELATDGTTCNVDFRIVGFPNVEFNITSYERETCMKVQKEILSQLQGDENLNLVIKC